METNTTALYRKINEDHAVRARLSALTDREELTSEVVRLGKGFSLPVAPEEVRTYLAGGQDDELSDDELEMVVGGKGNKEMIGNNSHEYMKGGGGDDTILGAGGDDTMVGGKGNDMMAGGDGNDYMLGCDGNDDMAGNWGNDSMEGGKGNDSMSGGWGNDALDGGVGNDTLDGGLGNDVLIGGSGHDVFVFGDDHGSDVIKDFNPAEDKITLTNWSDPETISLTHSSTIFPGSSLSVANQGGNTVIAYEHTTITLEGVTMTQEEVMARVQKG